MIYKQLDSFNRLLVLCQYATTKVDFSILSSKINLKYTIFVKNKTMPRKLKLEELNRLSAEAYNVIDKLPFVIILDNVRSMHNVGAVFRTSDAFKIFKIYLCGITPTPPHREIRKTALGAEDTVKWEHALDIRQIITALQSEGYHVAAIEQTEDSTTLEDFTALKYPKIAIILGNEVDGVSQEAVDLADTVVEIPQFGTKHSLNISVAAGIVMYEVSRSF